MSPLVRLHRLGYRLAYWALRVYWFLLRPRVRGVKCLLTDGELVLLVRHTYGDRRWDLPGGTLRRGEQPINAARREMAEELGIDVDDWVALGELSSYVYHHHDRLYCFQADVRAPKLTLALAELSSADWFPRDRLPDGLGRFVRPVLARTELPVTPTGG